MKFTSLSMKAAIWFGVSAAFLAVPWTFLRLQNINIHIWFNLIFGIFIPVFAAIVAGALLGGVLLNDHTRGRDKAFLRGFSVGLVAGGISIVMSFIIGVGVSLKMAELFPVASRFTSGTAVLSIMGLPVYGPWAGLSGIILKAWSSRRVNK